MAARANLRTRAALQAQVDAEAARVILQSWLEAHAHEAA